MYTKRVIESGTGREYEMGESRVTLYTQNRNDGFLTDMSIFVDEAKRGQGIARAIVQKLLFECDKEGFSPDYVYIDTDASGGFWDHVGFEPNPFYDGPQDAKEYGYEKRVAWDRLRQFAKS